MKAKMVEAFIFVSEPNMFCFLINKFFLFFYLFDLGFKCCFLIVFGCSCFIGSCFFFLNVFRSMILLMMFECLLCDVVHFVLNTHS